jgi:hypothetical protein
MVMDLKTEFEDFAAVFAARADVVYIPDVGYCAF